MDLLGLTGDRKQQRVRLEESGGGSEEESSVQNLMDSNCIQYRVTGGGGGEGGGGALSYRVVSQESEQSNGTTVNTNSIGNAVLASPLNGQFYVIGNPSDVLGGMGQRTIAPRAGPFSLDQSSVQNPKEDRQGTRRATHNEVERRRRDNINNWIMKLGKLIPDCNTSSDTSQGGKHAQSKGGILAKACEYLAETRNTNQRLVESLKQNEGVSAENERLSSQIEQLQQENAILKQQLQNHGIVPQPQDIKFSM